MTARTISIQSRQLAEQDAVPQNVEHRITPRRQNNLLQWTSAGISRAKESDTVMDDVATHDTAERFEKAPEKESWVKNLICFCRTPEGFNATLIACDGPCEEWYHNSCVEVTTKEAEKIENFICPICVRNGYGKTIWKREGAGQSNIGADKSGEDKIALAGFPRQTAVERKREHRALSLRAEGRRRSEVGRMKRW